MIKFNLEDAKQYSKLLNDATKHDHYVKTWKLYNVCRKSIGLTHETTLNVCYGELLIHRNVLTTQDTTAEVQNKNAYQVG